MWYKRTLANTKITISRKLQGTFRRICYWLLMGITQGWIHCAKCSGVHIRMPIFHLTWPPYASCSGHSPGIDGKKAWLLWIQWHLQTSSGFWVLEYVANGSKPLSCEVGDLVWYKPPNNISCKVPDSIFLLYQIIQILTSNASCCLYNGGISIKGIWIVPRLSNEESGDRYLSGSSLDVSIAEWAASWFSH